MKFITIDSQLVFNNQCITIKKLKHDPTKRYWAHSFVLLAIFIGFQTYRAIYDKPRAWIWVIIGFIWIYPHLESIFKKLFIYVWGNKIKLAAIKSIMVLPPENELETSLSIQLINGRKKVLTFRKAENQMVDFIEIIQQKANSIIILNTNI
ncbi:MAG: hypothetical protein ACOVNR_04705 [Chitinophagaceae bacterium]